MQTSLSDSGCSRHSFRQRKQESLPRQRIQETLYEKMDTGDTLLDRECRSHFIRQWMQEFLYQTADAGDILSDRGCRSLSIRHRMKDSLLQTADAGLPILDSRCNNLSDSECRTFFRRQWMQEILYQTSKCRNLSIRLQMWMQNSL